MFEQRAHALTDAYRNRFLSLLSPGCVDSLAELRKSIIDEQQNRKDDYKRYKETRTDQQISFPVCQYLKLPRKRDYQKEHNGR